MKRVCRTMLVLMCALYISLSFMCSLHAKAYSKSESTTVYEVSDEQASEDDSISAQSVFDQIAGALGYVSGLVMMIGIVIGIFTHRKRSKPFSQPYNYGHNAYNTPVYSQQKMNSYGQQQVNTYGQQPINSYGQPQMNSYGQQQMNSYGQAPMNSFNQPQNLSASPNTQQNFCAKCGSKIVYGSAFCANCGTKI